MTASIPPDQRQAIHELRLQLFALLDHSTAGAECKALAALMVAARWAVDTEMPPHLAASMLATYMSRDPLADSP